MMALQVPAANDKRRVKVYELKENDWFDRGTGFCTGQFVNVSIGIPSQSDMSPEMSSVVSRVGCLQAGSWLTSRGTGRTSSLCRIRRPPGAHVARNTYQQGGCLPEATRSWMLKRRERDDS